MVTPQQVEEFNRNGLHAMKQFVDLEDGTPMSETGEHFPTVCRTGEPVSVETQRRQN